jgi:hypothetical protein
MICATRTFTTREENCAENTPGEFWIGSRLLIQGYMLVITHFSEPFVKDNHRFVRFYAKVIEAVPTTTEGVKKEVAK